MLKKFLWFCGGVVFATAMTLLVCWLILGDEFYVSSGVILTSVPEISLLEDTSTLKISGRCKEDQDSVRLFVDHRTYAAIPVTDRKFQYSFAISELSEGWHIITVDSPDYKPGSDTDQVYAWVHIIPGQAHVVLPEWAVEQARADRNRHPREYSTDYVDQYTPSGRYFGFHLGQYRSSNLAFDSEGIPMVRINNGKNYAYNPTTISQYALSMYNTMLGQSGTERDKTKESFLRVASWLASHQQPNGSFPYSYTFSYKPDIVFAKGFVSGMAQGQMLSVYARAYSLSGAAEYLQAGQSCLGFMTSRADSPTGGTAVTLKDFTDLSPALKPYENYVLFEEYIAKPQTYVLNGNLFALVGLYDWAHAVPGEYGASQAGQAFEQGCKAVEVLLPYYDYNVYSAYDLLPFGFDYDPHFSSSYAHACHVYLLHTLAQVTDNSTFSAYYLRFKSYSDQEKEEPPVLVPSSSK